VVGAGLGGVTARQDCEGSRPSRVGQASDQASDVVGQAGAGSLRALRSQGTSHYGRLQLRATRTADVSLPRRNSTRPSTCPLQDGQLRSEPLSPPAPADRQPRRVPPTASQFRSVVSAPVSFVWEDVFYELKAGLRPGNDTPVTAEPTPSVSKVRRCGTHSDACRPDLHGSGHQVAGRDARQRRGGPARRPGAVERQSYRAWRRSLRRR
jgi:hypothetical protein